jgi:hypothetical protein
MATPPIDSSNLSRNEEEYLCHDFENDVRQIGLVDSLGRLYLLASQ